ncbi:MAG: 23S rRNA (adenine(2030)-N(6))-methyltransferase RlmJ [Alphaproteobacteria bacterium]|nr:23S rRNA (adenine(2030)-N(6))-methyltransferase RlmJ [Alphaproteobacteria bacterium]MBM3624474.1 23S rRNA (adenine(2030)-N(6))-methyltransferase RlmJ [Alphaproteobacteria bacterium]MBM3641958.1 23S rRNA (adenine(2030)-N(6))-methyltransferase RlmJ [Alphaproteobacteria bacterium]
MNYRHGFHAGNFADVFKHALLVRLLIYLTRKGTPFRVIDTHAGEGAYDLSAEEAERTGEWRGGVGRLADLSEASAEVRSLIEPYLDCLGPFDAEGKPAVYPGSPTIAQKLMRPQDRAIFCELRPDAFAALRRRFARDERIKTIHIDGYVGLAAYVPPKERRGLVLIDPPFEREDEFDAAFGALTKAYAKWNSGVYALWHPSKSKSDVRKFHNRLKGSGIRRILQLSLSIGGKEEGLRSSGMVVVNPPFVFEQEAKTLLEFLAQRLAQGEGAGYQAAWLAGE